VNSWSVGAVDSPDKNSDFLVLLPAYSTRRIVLRGGIRTSTLAECFLCSASVGEHADQPVVALVTTAFVDLILLLAVLL
jgi:hypothetical protein